MMIYTPNRRKAFQTGGSGGTGLLTDLSHWYDLGEASGNAIDSIGGADLTDTSAVTTGQTAPDGGGSRSGGGTDYFAGTIDTTVATTFAFWAYPTNKTGGPYSFAGPSNPHGGFYLGNLPDIGIRITNSGANTNSGSNDISENVWHSIVITTDASGVQGYLDGDLTPFLSSSNGFDYGTSGSFNILRYENGSREETGSIASFGVWDVKLSTSLITAFHNSGTNLRYADL